MNSDSQNPENPLAAYDPELGVPPTPEMERAWMELSENPDGQDRHELKCAFDRSFREAFSSYQAPAELKAALLEELVPSTLSTVRADERPPSRVWIHSLVLGGIAATIMLASIFFTFFVNPWKARETEQLKLIVTGINASLENRTNTMQRVDSIEEAAAIFSEAHVETPIVLPEGLVGKATFACSILDIDGVRISMACIRHDTGTYHLFTFDRSDLPNQEDILQPIFEEFVKYRTMTWTDDHLIYVLATRAPESAIRSLL